MTDRRRAFHAVLREGRGGGAFVEVPFDAREAFGSARPKVRATFDGLPDPPYRGSIAPMGGAHLLGVVKAVRAAIGKGIGDTVRVEVWPDTEPREVPVPDDLARALAAEPGARAAFDALSFTRRREIVRGIEGARRPETRERRVAEAVRAARP